MYAIKQTYHGLIAYNSNDTLIGKSINEYGEFAKEEINFLSNFIDGIVLDIGANIGTHTIPFAKKAQLVYAFEPQRLCYYNLCTNVILNNLTNVICLQQAVGNNSGRISIPELDFRKQNNFSSLSLDQNFNSPGSCSVKLVKIDELNLSSVRMIKIDTEGTEIEVIQGAIHTIEKFKPILYLQCQLDKSPTLINLLKNLNYDVYFHVCQLFNKNNYYGNEINHFGNLQTINIFCHQKPFIKPSNLRNLNEPIYQNYTNSLSDCIQTANNSYDLDAIELSIKNIISRSDTWEAHKIAIANFTRMLDFNKAYEYVIRSQKFNSNEFMFCKGSVLDGLGKYEESIECYRTAIKENPDCADAHLSFAFNLLLTKQFEEGWNEFEWRFQMNNPSFKALMNSLNKPFWDGSPLENRKLLVFIEQGVGDLIQFSRYLKFIKGDMTLICFKETVRLFKNFKTIAYDDNLFVPKDLEYDTVASITSLPRLLKIHSIPDCEIHPEPEEVILPYNELKVGFAWCGSAIHKKDNLRSCFLRNFKTLQMENVKFFSLQKGKDDYRYWPNKGIVNLMDEKFDYIDITDEFDDFNRTANFIQKLDLVITVDTSIVHLAGSLGIPTWLLLSNHPDWRWGTSQSNSEWYKSIKIFRGNWDDVFSRVRIELENYVQNRRRKMDNRNEQLG